MDGPGVRSHTSCQDRTPDQNPEQGLHSLAVSDILQGSAVARRIAGSTTSGVHLEPDPSSATALCAVATCITCNGYKISDTELCQAMKGQTQIIGRQAEFGVR